ncbi:MAG: type II secretion system protein N [Novosphingobium sp.]
MIGRWIFIRGQAMGRRGWLALAALFIVALIVLMPLRMILGLTMPETITARSVEGSVWGGRIGDLNAGPLPLGTVDAGLEPLPLLIGRPQFAIARDGFSATIAPSRIIHANGSVQIPDGLGGLPVTSVGLGDFSAAMADGQCTEAQGTLSLTLAALGPLLPDAITVSGQARCEKGALVVPMRGPQGMERLTLKIGGDGRWQADLTLAGLPQETVEALKSSGFDTRPGGIGIGTSGTF